MTGIQVERLAVKIFSLSRAPARRRELAKEEKGLGMGLPGFQEFPAMRFRLVQNASVRQTAGMGQERRSIIRSGSLGGCRRRRRRSHRLGKTRRAVTQRRTR